MNYFDTTLTLYALCCRHLNGFNNFRPSKNNWLRRLVLAQLAMTFGYLCSNPDTGNFNEHLSTFNLL